MNNFKEFIKSFIKAELKGWKRGEVIALTIVFAVIFINAILVKDSIIAVISAVCGILYSTIAGKGKISCYFFGLAGTCCYSWLSFENALWGNLILYMCYYFPMQVFGIFSWSRHLKKDTREIVKKRMNTYSLMVPPSETETMILIIDDFEYNGILPPEQLADSILSHRNQAILTVRRSNWFNKKYGTPTHYYFIKNGNIRQFQDYIQKDIRSTEQLKNLFIKGLFDF